MRAKRSPAQQCVYENQLHAEVCIDKDVPQSQFYRSFTRPIAKTLLIAVFTYQLAYWTWVKLETDEIRAEREG